MKRMIYVLVILLLSFTIYSCAKKSDSSSSSSTTDPSSSTTDPSSSTTELEGTWLTSCYTQAGDSDNHSWIESFIFSGTSLVPKAEKFSNSNCTTALQQKYGSNTFSYGDNVTFNNGNTGRKITITLSTTKKLPQSSIAVSDFNSSNECGYSNWELNTEKDCPGEGEGSTVYGLYQLLDNGTLYLETSSNDNQTSVSTNSASSTFVKQ